MVSEKNNNFDMSAIGNKFDFDEWYAMGWSKKQGQFSDRLARTVIHYFKENKIVIKSLLDVCSGSGEFLGLMKNICSNCVGIDSADGYLAFAQREHHDCDFRKVDCLYNFNLKEKFDMVSCNHDVVNMFTSFDKFESFLKTANKHIGTHGLLLFDFYTKNYLENLEEIVFEESDDLDFVSKKSQYNGLCVMNETYYVKESSQYYRKTKDVMVEAWYETDKIVEAIKNAGFKKIKLVNDDLAELSEDEIKTANRIFVLAEK